MKRRNSGNNGYLGIDKVTSPTTGKLTSSKIYNIDVREIPYYQFGNTANTFGMVGANYQRPTEWPALPGVTAGSQQIVGLFAVYDNDTNVCGLRIQGAYQVDWGDGTSNTYANDAIAVKRYDRASYAGFTSSVFRNYKTVLIKVTPQAGQTFTNVQFSPQVSGTISGYSSTNITNWLDVRMAGSLINTLSVSQWAGNSIYTAMLELFEFVGDASLTSFSFIDCRSLKTIISFPSTRLVTYWQSIFYGCRALQEIPRSALDGLLTGNGSPYTYTFYQCSSLKRLPIDYMDFKSSTTSDGLFNGCSSLKIAPQFINTQNMTSMTTTFAGCVYLEEVLPFDTIKNTDFYLMFYLCWSLKKVPSSFSGASAAGVYGMFLNCPQLQSLPYINTKNVTNFQYFARGCSSLETIPEYDFTSATTISGIFYESYNLKYVPNFKNSSSLLTNMNSAFQYCSSLIEAPGITASNVTDITNLFNGCPSLKTIPNYNFSKVTSSSSAFPTSGSLISVGITGCSFSVSYASNTLGATALNDIYSSLATVGISGAGARTITVTGNWGTATDNPAIAIAKGWTVTG